MKKHCQVYVAADDEFRPFHILSTRAFSSLAPQVSVRARDDALVNGSDDASSNGSCDESDDRLAIHSHVVFEKFVGKQCLDR